MDDDVTLLNVYKEAARAFIISYTGLTPREVDHHEDLALAYLVLINDMSYNRDYAVNKDTVNPTVSAILNLYTRNNIA